ncbi:hypothetical protein Prudu_013466, partial [Prunus dulcis]
LIFLGEEVKIGRKKKKSYSNSNDHRRIKCEFVSGLKIECVQKSEDDERRAIRRRLGHRFLGAIDPSRRASPLFSAPQTSQTSSSTPHLLPSSSHSNPIRAITYSPPRELTQRSSSNGISHSAPPPPPPPSSSSSCPELEKELEIARLKRELGHVSEKLCI